MHTGRGSSTPHDPVEDKRGPVLCVMATSEDLEFEDFQDVSDLLTVSLDAPDLSVSSCNTGHTEEGGVAFALDLSEDDDQEEKSKLLGEENERGSMWTFEYCQSFFNVDTVQVLDRIRGSLIPLPGRNFVRHHLHSNPDLYGPLWICVTLAFSLSIGGNLSTFLTLKGDPKYHYRPQFHTVSVAAVSVFLYALLVPVCVWGFLKWRQGTERHIRGYSYLETVCVYGYSLFIYIPTSVLWIIPIPWLRWVSILVAVAISGSVLVITFWPVVRDDRKAAVAVAVAAIVLLHALLAIGSLLLSDGSAHSGSQTNAPFLQQHNPADRHLHHQENLTDGRREDRRNARGDGQRSRKNSFLEVGLKLLLPTSFFILVESAEKKNPKE
ncbi:protein YIPF2-like isoform X2 [Anguilla rostrata]|uniref:protein YIPF2-like isoform X2 n=1 Tax=Anguilla rostrata TaxID=7938 RepID=UPI0030CB508F